MGSNDVPRLTFFTAPIDSAQDARDVREDTAELASYALSEQASSIHSGSPSQRAGSITQSHIESYFQQDEDDRTTSQSIEHRRRNIIQEVSEPTSPENGSSGHKSPGNSVLADMIRRSPPSTSPPQSDGTAQADDVESESDRGDPEDYAQQRLIITSNGVKVAPDESTPLIRKQSAEPHHLDYIHGQSDLEGQQLQRRASWPKLHRLAKWPVNRGRDVVSFLTNPKSWDRKVIWQNAVVAPAGFMPAVILGCLLNILDALSYGTLISAVMWLY
jgi:SulP family sulfate permease